MTIALYPATSFTDDVSTINADALNTWRANLAKCIDGDAGGAYTPTAKLQIGGLGLEITPTAGAAKSVQLASRAVVIVQSMVGFADTANDWAHVAEWPYWRNIGNSGQALHLFLDIPNGQVLNSVTVRYIGASGGGGHTGLGGLPDPMPSIEIYKVDVDGTWTSLAAATLDGSGSIAAYEALHSITTTGDLAHTIDRKTYAYYARILSEGATRYLANAEVYGCSATVTVTSLAEF